MELTVPWEDGVEEAYERKKTKYSELATEAAQNGWKTKIFPVEVGCTGFVATSMTSLLKKMGVRVAPSNKQSSPCQMQWKKAAIGFGLKGKTTTAR